MFSKAEVLLEHRAAGLKVISKAPQFNGNGGMNFRAGTEARAGTTSGSQGGPLTVLLAATEGDPGCQRDKRERRGFRHPGINQHILESMLGIVGLARGPKIQH